ncbi:WecB/TagA/CpsF family glycosyltransferase [Paenibacillus turpanensis]|uniref:WecB/TagA/CpsF family glycosyltransferase n=1 Tax=Paenibacillus turpanensis TaxID=2689078 RepID=UPI00140AA958|nr:WecB/TagA/CpsF family glycosyltransferase [Paenibacillus turpanensis]
MNIPTVSIYGIPVSKLNMKDTVRLLSDIIRRKEKPHQVVTANPIMVMAALEQPEYMAMMKRAELVIPDGAGLVWATGYVGNPVSERVAGFDLVQELMNVGRQEGWKVYLIGTTADAIAKAADKFQELYPGIQIVGARDGYFGEAEDAEVIASIQEAKPDILLVGRSASTQEPWIGKYKEQLGVPVMIGVGGTFDIMADKIKRAPLWMQKLSLEWLFRLIQEPYRFPRMLVLPKFAVKVILEKNKVRNS